MRQAVGVPLRERLPLLAVRSNPLRGFEMLAGLHYTYLHPVRVNALGLRGPELAPKAADEVRVLAVGDSLTYGQGVADDQTLPFHLERELERLDPHARPWTVVNGGLRGYDTRQELGLIQELAATIEPDVVVLYWFWNDFYEHPILRSFARLEDHGPVVYDTGNRLEGSELWAWRLRQLVRRSALVMFLHDRVRAALSSPDDPAFFERGLERLGRYLDRFEELAGRHGFRPVVAIVPERNRLRGPDFTEHLDRRAADLARERGLAVIELYEPVRELAQRAGRLPVLPYDGHYTGEANHAMALASARELLLLLANPD